MRKKAYMGWEDLFTGDNESFVKELGDGYDAFIQTDFQGGIPYDYNKHQDNAEWIFWVTTPNREWLAEPEYLGSMTFEDACLAADFMLEAYEDAISEDKMRFARNRRHAGATNEQYDAWLADGFGAGNHFSAMLNGRLVGPYPMTGEMLALFRTDPACECVAIYETGEIVWDRNMGLSKFYAKRRKRAYTDEQMKVLRDYYFDKEVYWRTETEEEEVIDSLAKGLELANGKLGDRWEYSWSTPNRGIYAESMYDYYYFGEGVFLDEAPEPLPEFFPNSGLWCDGDFADAYNAHISELQSLFSEAFDLWNEFDEFDSDWYMDDARIKEHDAIENALDDVMADLIKIHTEALNDMCNAATKLLNSSYDYYYSDEAADEAIYDYAEEWIENGLVWFDED